MAAVDNRPRKINLDDVNEDEGIPEGTLDGFDQDVDFETITGVVPRGEYYLRNERIDLKLSKSSNRPMFTVRAVIQNGQYEGTSLFQDFSWAEGRAQVRSKKAFVGMGLPVGYKGSLRNMADQALKDLEYYAVVDIEQSDGINEATHQPYDPRNRIVSTSETPQHTG